MLRLRLLGDVSLTGEDGQEVLPVISHPKPLAVFSFLALEGQGGFVSRDRLMALFWAESDTTRARNALSQALYLLRNELASGLFLTRGKWDLGLDPGRMHCDVWAFREALARNDPTAALEWYGGDLMAGFHLRGDREFERWLEEKREHLRETAAGAAWAAAHHLLARGEPLEAERTAQRALGLVGTDESEVRRFVQALADAGDRAAAVNFFNKFSRLLAEDLQLEPAPETVEVVEGIRQRSRDGPGAGSTLQVGGAPSTSREATPSRLEAASAQAPVFVGRDLGGGPGHPERPGGEPRPLVRRIPGGGRTIGGVALAAAVLLSLPLLRYRGDRGPLPANRPFTVLADVEGTADAPEREALAFFLRMGLDMAQVVQTVPESEMTRVLTLMDRSRAAPLDGPTAREAAVRLGVPTVVVARFDRLGEAYSVALRVEDANSGRLYAGALGRAGDPTTVLTLADSLLRELRRSMGESEGVLANAVPLPDVLTASLPALLKYQEGNQAQGDGRGQAAVVALREAVALDPDFAMAWMALQGTYGNLLGMPDSARWAAEHGLRLSHRLTPASRADIRMRSAAWADVASWDEVFEEDERAIQEDSRYTGNYAYVLATLAGQVDSALALVLGRVEQLALEARRFDPSVRYQKACWVPFLYYVAAADRAEEWRRLLVSRQVDETPGCVRELDLFETLASAEWDRADSLIRSAQEPWPWPDQAELASRQMEAARGRIMAVHQDLLRELGSGPADPGPFEVAPLILEVVYGLPADQIRGIDGGVRRGSLAELAFGDRTPAGEGDVPRVEGQAGPHARRFDPLVQAIFDGVRSALVGDTVTSKQAYARLAAFTDTAASRSFQEAFEPWFALMDVGPAAQRGDWTTVVHALEPLAARTQKGGVGFAGGDTYLTWWLLAQAYEAQGESESAIVQLRRILQRPRARLHDWILQGFIHPAARLRLARILADAGDTASALEHYQAFLDTFTDPEPEFAWMVEAARQAVASLGGPAGTGDE